MRVERRLQKRKKIRRNALVLVGLCVVIAGIYFGGMIGNHPMTKELSEETQLTTSKEIDETSHSKAPESQTITITASGDMLYHRPLYMSAYDGEQYDFDNDYSEIKPLISGADLALGDFEGTINPEVELGGFPLFNAPPNVVDSIKDAGFDVIDLGHNHILDTGIEGLQSTAKAFREIGLDTIGVNVDDSGILVKEVKGIRVAMLAYAYGFNGLENNLSQEEQAQYLNDLSMDQVEADIKEAEQIADITIVMPQAGVEYAQQPSEEQQTIYRKMVDFGADIVFGGHPHVAQPTEIIDKDGEAKFIIYSMGNLLSNQRYETLDGNYWTERGVIPEVEVTKEGERTFLSNITLHPTWVSKIPIEGRTYDDWEFGTMQAYDFQVVLAEDYLPDGKSVDTVDEETQQRIATAYQEMLEHLDLQWE
ncbi:hypothetical protein A5886_000660 [Enterococcus sp. 8G7_MSG3316]|uniref:Capsule synthesis protein CapA domain-containing protein n=1 Tax=Candidatus Enterococcus testudinis TaxID=1834191 RepID=A0A242A3H6_9ENTE|nr:CapA family protein [Enterococcus sp. 8G7_MSG3316]OTN75586.1 hypothetical protein A5886_000660 [Enterococcus sp. 8G7_MSG3316]